MLRVVACMIVGEMRRMMVLHLQIVVWVKAEFGLPATADMTVQAVGSDVAEVWASSVVEEALALEVANLCLLWAACALHRFWVARLLRPM
jgi:hypothetical protein